MLWGQTLAKSVPKCQLIEAKPIAGQRKGMNWGTLISWHRQSICCIWSNVLEANLSLVNWEAPRFINGIPPRKVFPRTPHKRLFPQVQWRLPKKQILPSKFSMKINKKHETPSRIVYLCCQRNTPVVATINALSHSCGGVQLYPYQISQKGRLVKQWQIKCL